VALQVCESLHSAHLRFQTEPPHLRDDSLRISKIRCEGKHNPVPQHISNSLLTAGFPESGERVESESVQRVCRDKRRLRTSSGVRSRQKSLFGGVGHTLQFPETLRQKLVNVPQVSTHVDTLQGLKLFCDRLKHKDVFTLIQKHNLYGVIQDMLIDLMELDHKQTIALLLEKNTISSDKIVEKLRPTQLHLYRVSRENTIDDTK
jgi:hypothetical protein